MSTVSWWLKVVSLGIKEYASPFLAFDEQTLAAVAEFNAVVDIAGTSSVTETLGNSAEEAITLVALNQIASLL